VPLQRVVGYYEGRAARRYCDKFRPNNIPAGVYTHLNFAYASIDPITFHIIPAAEGDPELYRELTGLKGSDPGRPAETAFSDIARSRDNQRAFISSLISFMNTYGFDGVDIDWEYPQAEDRGGRDEDFVNFPIFVRNLKRALNNNGFRNGLSITLPVSYWYLRHFDIQKMLNSVDWFGFKSYDLHGK
jgi:GH18 family chitinase